MKDLIIFPALLAALIITVFFETKFFVIFMIILIIRVLIIENKFLLGVMLVTAVIFGFRCQLLLQQTHPKPELKKVIFMPDKLSVNGDSLSGVLQADQQSVRFFYRIKSPREQRYWQNLTEMVQAKVAVKDVQPIARPRNRGEFDFAKYSQHQGIYYSAQLATISPPKIYYPTKIIDKINVLRIHIINYLSKLPKWLRIHAQSLLVGYTGYSDKNFLKILSVLGVIHLFSLSGLHVLILLTILRKFTSLLKIPLEWVNTVMLVILPCYGLLVGSKSGIWRAIVLAMLGIICHKLKLDLSRLDIFSLTLLICLLIYPFAITEMGGQLSFVLSFAILYLYQEASFWQTTFKMNLVSLPLICFYTYQFNWLTWLANIFFVPFFSYVILPVTIISSLTVSWDFWKWVNQLFSGLYVFLDHLVQNNQFLFVTGRFPSWLTLILVICTLFYIESKNIKNRYLAIFLTIFAIGTIGNKFPLTGQVTMIDVGQGDSILITTPLKRQTFLLDVGGKLHFLVKPWAKRQATNQVETSTIPFLKSQGISKIDKLFLTHKDVDHIGNLATLLDKMAVKEVNFGSGLENNQHLKQAMEQHPEVNFSSRRQGDVIKTDFIDWQVLWPKVKSIGENGDSLTMFSRIKNKSWLFTGDLDTKSEAKILTDHQFKIDFLKVGHHGSKTSTSDLLLERTQPQFGFISAGVKNRYGHPNKETLERLQQHKVQYFNTADYGMISWYYNFFDNKEKVTTFLKGDLFEDK